MVCFTKKSIIDFDGNISTPRVMIDFILCISEF